MTPDERERLDLYNSLTDAEAAEMDDSDIADYEALSATAQAQPQEAPNEMQEADQAQAQAPVKAGQSKVVPAAQGAVSKAIDWIAPKIETANEMSRAWPQFVANTISPNVGELAEQQGDDFSLLSTDYLKAAGKDLLRAAPLATSAIGAPVAGLGALGRAGYMGLRGALESSGFAGLENLLRPDNEQISTIDAAALGGALGGGMSGGADLVGAGLSKTIPRIREFMANRAGVSPEALQAYSTPEGRALIAGAFGQEDRIAKDLLDIASPKYMEYMPETQAFNELVGKMKGKTNLVKLSPYLRYNPLEKSGGEHLFEGEKQALKEITENYSPILKRSVPKISTIETINNPIKEGYSVASGTVGPQPKRGVRDALSLKGYKSVYDWAFNESKAGRPIDYNNLPEEIEDYLVNYGHEKSALFNDAMKAGLKDGDFGTYGDRVALPTFAKRIGKANESGVSYNYRDQRPEQGLSVMSTFDDNIENEMADKSYKMFNSGENRLFYGLKSQTQKGSDGEELLLIPDDLGPFKSSLLSPQSVAKKRMLEMQGPGIDYRTVTPTQLNELKKRLGAELDDSWNKLERGVHPSAVKVGKDLYRGMREELLAIAEREGMDEAKNLLKAQAKKLGARDEFLKSWTGNTSDKQNAELRIRENIAGVMQKPSIRKIDKMEKLSELDRAIGTSFAPDVTSASYARELASESARPGRYSASIIPKLQTGKAGTGVLSAIGLPLIGGSPVTGAGYLANLNALENMAQGAAGAQLPVASAVIPFLREYR